MANREYPSIASTHRRHRNIAILMSLSCVLGCLVIVLLYWEELRIRWWVWRLGNKNYTLAPAPNFSDANYPLTSIGRQAYWAKHMPWMLKPKREGAVLAAYDNHIILIDMGEKQMMAEGDEITIFKEGWFKGRAKVIKVFADKSLCKVLIRTPNREVCPGDSITTKLSD